MVQKKQAVNRLAKFIDYMLGRQPDEFGLVPDDRGYVKVKEFLKAISEEEGFRHVRKSHLDEILVSIPNPPMEIEAAMIRAKNRSQTPHPQKTDTPPKHLYTCIRRRAHPHVLEKGIISKDPDLVILSVTKEMAVRMGKRIDAEPVLLTIQSEKAMERQVDFFKMGEHLYLAENIPPGCFIAPPLPKQAPEGKPKAMEKEDSRNAHPGSFEIMPNRLEKKGKRMGRKNEVGWKQELRKSKRNQRKR